ncbi:MAG: hypothetical protein ACYTF3_09755 [Planctomycetota bacterium]|jgi:hypothetical protein
MKTRCIALISALALAAVVGCDDGDSDSSSSSGGGLSSLFGGGSSNNEGGSTTGGGETGGGETGGGTTGGGETGGGPVTGGGAIGGGDNCQAGCERVIRCLGPGGCPVWNSIPEAQLQEGVRECAAGCTGVSDAELAELQSLSCAQVTQLLASSTEDFDSICNPAGADLNPGGGGGMVDSGTCGTFCNGYRECTGEPLSDADCQQICAFAPDAIECAVNAYLSGGCAAVESACPEFAE